MTRLELSAADLRRAATGCGDSRAACRMLAIALVLDGASRTEAAEACGMDRQTLRDWVHRYNDDGIAGLFNRPTPGRPPALTPEQMIELKARVLAGPDPATDGVVRWRCCDLRQMIAERFEVEVHERTVGKLLKRLNVSRLKPRPHHPKRDLAAQEAFRRNFAERVEAVLPAHAAGKPIEVWFQDEARVGQQGTLTHVWAERGSRPPGIRDDRHDSAWLFGAICPARCIGAALVMPWVSSEAMSLHLAEIGKAVSPGAHALLICDGAGWHQHGERLRVPDNVSLLHLPSYAPQLNPLENVWEYLRGNHLSISVWDTYDEIVEVCCRAWNSLIACSERVASLTRRSWAQVSH